MAVPITEEWEGSICAGSILHDKGAFYCFYSIRDKDGGGAPLHRSISADGVAFEKDSDGMHVLLNAPYDPVPARVPCVFKDNTGRYHMLVTTQLVNWYYLIFSNHGVARYLKSRNPFGPWDKPEYNIFDGPLSGVMKSAAFAGNRRIGASFLRKNRYGGNLVLREIVQQGDGNLSTHFVQELLPQDSQCESPVVSPLTSGIKVESSGEISMDTTEGFSAWEVQNTYTDFYLRLTVEPTDNSSAFGICVKSDKTYDSGMELNLEPEKRKVGWRQVGGSSWAEYEAQSLYSVDSLSDQSRLRS